MARFTQEDYERKVKELTGEEYSVLGNYKNMSTKIEMKHNKCGHNYMVVPTSFIHSGTRCPNCYGRKKVTKEMFSERIKNNGYELVGEYTKYSNKVEVKHECGYTWSVYPQTLYQGKSGCPKCAGNAKLTKDDFIKRVKSMYKNDEYIFLEDYKGYLTKIKCKHNCGYVWKTTPGNFLAGKTCPKCEGSMKLTQEQVDARMYELFKGEYTFLEPYINISTSILCRHTCGHEWKVKPENLFNGRRCPKCKRESKRERLISYLLDNLEVIYEREKTFPNLKYRGLLRIDFFLPDLDIAIEYDGEHHFKDYRYTSNTKSLDLTMKRDNIKNKYCKENNIELVRIPYYKTDEEIIEIVENIINVKSNAKAIYKS